MPDNNTETEQTIFNIITPSAHSYTTSTFEQSMKEETERVRGTGRTYNPDVDPPQSPYLKRNNLDIGYYVTREKLLEISHFLREHTYDVLEEKTERGWELVKKNNGNEDSEENIESPDWNNDLKWAFIDATAKAMVIDTAYIVKFVNDKYGVFTHNDEYKLYGDDNRDITEIYFRYPAQPDLINEKTNSNYKKSYVGVLTQNTDDIQRPNRYITSNESPPHIYRDCVILQPVKSIRKTHGESYLYRECQTASEKIHLRFYELLFIHKGGINNTTVIPAGQTKSIRDNAVRQSTRGMLSRGTVMEVKSGKPINDIMMIVQTPIPDLKFETVNSHLSEDAKLTKQKMEGGAETGALGGKAPIVNKMEDENTKQSFLMIMETVIKNINDVFFNIDPETYNVKFLRPEFEIDNENDVDESIDNKKEEMEDLANQYFDYDEYEFMSPDIEIYAHSINDEFVVYEGNMLQAGTYFYPEKDKSEVFTKEDIKRMCERNVKTGYLELNHSFNENKVGIDEGVGYFEITGYNSLKGTDITKFYIKKNIAKTLNPAKIKLSPYFFKRNRKIGGKDVFVKNCAIVTKGRPRAELSGLETSAKRTF